MSSECNRCEVLNRNIVFLQREIENYRQQAQQFSDLVTLNRSTLTGYLVNNINNGNKIQQQKQNNNNKNIHPAKTMTATTIQKNSQDNYQAGIQTRNRIHRSHTQVPSHPLNKQLEKSEVNSNPNCYDQISTAVFSYLIKENSILHTSLSRALLQRDNAESRAFVNEQIADGVQRQEKEIFSDFAERYATMSAMIDEQQKTIQKLNKELTKNPHITSTIRYKEVTIGREAVVKLNERMEKCLKLLGSVEERKIEVCEERNELLVLNGVMEQEIRQLRDKIKVLMSYDAANSQFLNKENHNNNNNNHNSPDCSQTTYNNFQNNPQNTYSHMLSSPVHSNQQTAIQTMKKMIHMDSEESEEGLFFPDILTDKVKFDNAIQEGLRKELVPQLDLTKAKKIQEINLQKQMAQIKQKDHYQATLQLKMEKEKEQAKKATNNNNTSSYSKDESKQWNNNNNNNGNNNNNISQGDSFQKQGNENIWRLQQMKQDQLASLYLQHDQSFLQQELESKLIEKIKNLESDLIKTKMYLEDEMIGAQVMSRQLDEFKRKSNELEAINATLVASNLHLNNKLISQEQLLSQFFRNHSNNSSKHGTIDLLQKSPVISEKQFFFGLLSRSRGEILKQYPNDINQQGLSKESQDGGSQQGIMMNNDIFSNIVSEANIINNNRYVEQQQQQGQYVGDYSVNTQHLLLSMSEKHNKQTTTAANNPGQGSFASNSSPFFYGNKDASMQASEFNEIVSFSKGVLNNKDNVKNNINIENQNNNNTSILQQKEQQLQQQQQIAQQYIYQMKEQQQQQPQAQCQYLEDQIDEKEQSMIDNGDIGSSLMQIDKGELIYGKQFYGVKPLHFNQYFDQGEKESAHSSCRCDAEDYSSLIVIQQNNNNNYKNNNDDINSATHKYTVRIIPSPSNIEINDSMQHAFSSQQEQNIQGEQHEKKEEDNNRRECADDDKNNEHVDQQNGLIVFD